MTPEHEKLCKRLHESTLDIETGERCESGTFAAVTVEDAEAAATAIRDLSAEVFTGGECIDTGEAQTWKGLSTDRLVTLVMVKKRAAEAEAARDTLSADVERLTRERDAGYIVQAVLSARVMELEGALRPFASHADAAESLARFNDCAPNICVGALRYEDVRRARAVLSTPPRSKPEPAHALEAVECPTCDTSGRCTYTCQ